MVTYCCLNDPAWRPHACSTLELLLEGAGARATRVEDPRDAVIVYSREKIGGAGGRSVLWIRDSSVPDWNTPAASFSMVDGVPVFHQGTPPGSLKSGGLEIPADILYSAYALVTGAFEQTMPRNSTGMIITKGTPLQATGALKTPLIALYAGLIQTLLSRALGDGFSSVPLWPDGKEWAIVLTHDADSLYTFPRASHYRRALAARWTDGQYLRMVPAARNWGACAFLGGLGMIPEAVRDPNFAFEKWIEYERSIGCTSCFYVAGRSAADPGSHPNDVHYDLMDPNIGGALETVRSNGWEIGLHASINAREGEDRLREEKCRLERLTGTGSISGVRHHYWALDPRLPERTLWSHAAGGFLYDSSLGMNDSPGFRRGMAWPFHPFDRERKMPVPILEIPPTLMDGGIFYQAVTLEEGMQQIRDHLSIVSRYCGAAVLDWHVEQMNFRRLNGAGRALVEVLRELSADERIFWASPKELAAWWMGRRKRIASLPVD
jgi:hypothetical protein